MNKFSIVPAPIKRSKAIKAKMAKAGINEDLMIYNKLSLSSDLACVQKYQTKVNQALEELAEALQEAGFAEAIGEDQFSTMVEVSKQEKGNPFPASCQSTAHKQNLIDSGEVPAELWELDTVGVAVAKTDLSAGLSLD